MWTIYVIVTQNNDGIQKQKRFEFRMSAVRYSTILRQQDYTG